MCRYLIHPVKTHWACIPCRWTAKHQPLSPAPGAIAPRCPTCRQEMVDLGRDFKAPRRENDRQWRKVALLVDADLLFDACGCRGPGPRPRTLGEAQTQLRRRRTHQRVYASASGWR